MPLTLHCKVCGKAKYIADPGITTEENTCYFCPDCSGIRHEVWACRLCCLNDPKGPCPYEVQKAIIKRTMEPLCQALGSQYVRQEYGGELDNG